MNNRNTRKSCEICSQLTLKTPERRQRLHSDVCIGNFEHISHLVLVFLLLTSSIFFFLLGLYFKILEVIYLALSAPIPTQTIRQQFADELFECV